MLALEARGLLGVALSGAGPSVLALVEPHSDAGSALQAIFAQHGVESRIFDLALSDRGIVREG
jgi:homoserine kinase